MIKKFLILISLILASLISIAQNQDIQRKNYKKIVENNCLTYYQTLIDRDGFVYEWGLSGIACYGCASHYTKIMRTTLATNGVYTYYVFFYSNSYNINGYLAGTYLTGINICVINSSGIRTNVLYMEYFLINPKTIYFDGINLGAIFYSKSPDEVVNITWRTSSVY